MQENDLRELKDEELIDLLREGNDNICDFLMNKYKNLVRAEAKNMFILGGDSDDLIQEGMIGLYKAIRDYDPGRDASFLTFARLCVSRQMFTAIKAADTLKHTMLNSYTSIYDEDFEKEGGPDPEEIFIDKERAALIEERFRSELSDFETQVLDLKLTGHDYGEIAAILMRDKKSVDNALQRMKGKLKKVIIPDK